MPHINRYRIINYVYGEKKNRLMTEDMCEPLGRHMQVEADNTVGKTMSVALVLQPILPFIQVDKATTAIFNNTKQPFYVLLEWILEDRTKLLTGIGIQRKAGTASGTVAENFNALAFTIEYQGQSTFDIETIPIMQVINGKTTIESLDKLQSILEEGTNEHRIKTFKYPSRKEYAMHLATFGIFKSEWKEIILPLNKGEANLSNYYKSYPNNEKLFEGAIIPAIEKSFAGQYDTFNEDKSNKGPIDNIRKAFEDFKELVTSYNDEIKHYENLEKLDAGLSDLLEQLYAGVGFEEAVVQCKVELAEIYKGLEDHIEETKKVIKDYSDQIEHIKDKIDELDYQEKSLHYYQTIDQIEVKQEELKNLLTTLQENNHKIKNFEKMLTTLDLKDILKDITGFENELGQKKSQKIKLEGHSQNLEQQMHRLGYSIKFLLEEREAELNTTKNEITCELNKVIKRLVGISEESKKLTDQKNIKQNIKVKKEFWLEDYEKKEAKLIEADKRVNAYIENRLEGKSFSLDHYISYLEHYLKETSTAMEVCQADIKATNREIQMYRDHISEAKFSISTLSVTKSHTKSQLEEYQTKKAEIDAYVAKYNIISSIKDIAALIQENENIKQHYIQESRDIQKEIAFLSGKTELPQTLRKELEHQNITLVTGLEYLDKAEVPLDKRQELYKNNPLLPYAIVLTSSDYQKISHIKLQIPNLAPIPVIDFSFFAKENSEVRLNEGTFEYENCKFLNFFDQTMLDKDTTKSKMNILQEKHNRLEDGIQELGILIQNLNAFRGKIEAFGYSKNYENEQNKSLQKLNLQLQEMDDKIVGFETEGLNLEKNTEELIKKEMRLKEELSSLQGKLKAAQTFNEDYAIDYNANYTKYQALSLELTQITGKMDNLQKEKDSLEEIQAELKERIANQNTEGLKNAELLTKFRAYEETHRIQVSLEDLLGQYKELKKDTTIATLEDVINRISQLQEALENKHRRKEELIEEIGEGYKDRLQEVYVRDQVIKILRQEKEKYDNNNKKSGELSELIKGLEKVKKAHLAEIFDKYRKEPISSRGDIPQIDYKIKKSELSARLQGFETEIAKHKEDIQSMESEREKILQVVEKPYELTKHAVRYETEKYKEVIRGLSKKINQTNENSVLQQKKISTTQEGLKEYILEDNKQTYNGLINIAILSERYTICEEFKLCLQGEMNRLQHCKDEIDKEKNILYSIIEDYINRVLNAFKAINNLAKINGERLFNININEDYIDYKEIYSVINGALENDITHYITTYKLVDWIAKIGKVNIQIMKFELYGKQKLINWEGLENHTTGAQRFCAGFIIISVLMDYARYNENDMHKQIYNKTLLMDNPFGTITKRDLLDPVFALAKKLGVQFISYTHIKDKNVRDFFDCIYSLRVEKLTNQSDREIVRMSRVKDIESEIDEITQQNKYVVQESLFRPDLIE